MSREEKDRLVEIAASLVRQLKSTAELLKDAVGVLQHMKTEEEYARSK